MTKKKTASKKKTATKKEVSKRKVLVILSNRWNKSQAPKFLELDCDPEGNILKEATLRSEPRERRFDEVWENDEGKNDFAACHKFSRKYTHKLQKPKP